MKNTHAKKLLLFGLIALAVVCADVWTKHLVIENIPLHRGFQVVPGYFNLVHARNPGGAFSFMAGWDSPSRHWFFVGVAFIALAVTLWMMVSAREHEPLLVIGCAFFFGGALGNLLDRLRFGEVIDFLDFHVGNYHWPAFNIADSALCIGVGFFLLHFVRGSR